MKNTTSTYYKGTESREDCYWVNTKINVNRQSKKHVMLHKDDSDISQLIESLEFVFIIS